MLQYHIYNDPMKTLANGMGGDLTFDKLLTHVSMWLEGVQKKIIGWRMWFQSHADTCEQIVK
jgi:hypothetical protein